MTLINESELNDSIHIVLAKNRDQMVGLIGSNMAGLAHTADKSSETENRLVSVFNDTYHPLKHELMHIISGAKWGRFGGGLSWLSEGLAVFSDPEAEDCNGYTIEERYVFLLQNKRLSDISSFIDLPLTNIGYTQAGYIVEFLYKKYGVVKLRSLWTNGLCKFEEIYGLSLGEMISDINTLLNKKYPNPIDITWEIFNKQCIE